MATPILLDCDPGHDDAVAMLLAAGNEAIDLLAVTTVAGNCALDLATLNARRVAALAGLVGVPIAAGAAGPLHGELVTAPDIHGATGLDGYELRTGEAPLDPRPALELMAATLDAAREPVTLVPTGPLTNVAQLLSSRHDLHGRIREIVLMGGSTGRGNTTPAAEFNVFVDPEAAAIVFASGLPLTMIGLNLTHQARATPEVLERVRALPGEPARAVEGWMSFFGGAYQRVHGAFAPPVHDPCTVAMLIDPSLIRSVDTFVAVETEGRWTRGATVVDLNERLGRPHNARVALELDAARFWDLVLGALERLGERLGMTHVLIVGGGNAGFCAAHAAVQAGATATIVEKAPAAAAGGNSFYTAGAFRVVHGGLDAVLGLIDDETTRARARATTLDPYPPEAFRDDMERLTEGRCDPLLTRILIDDSEPVVGWLADAGVRWRLMYERQAYERDGRFVFWGGLALGTVDGGKGLIAQHTAAARASGVELVYGTAMTGLARGADGRVSGVRVRGEDGAERELEADAVVVAAGGFEADAELRERHLGPGWGRALVRGNPLNTGEVLVAVLEAGAAPHGDWSSCHSVAWDAGADEGGGDRELTNQYTRSGYPLGIMVNRDGRRFVDEGADYRNYTYARYGRDILAQPGGVAFQLFDAKLRPLLRAEEYDSARVTGAQAGTLAELAERLGIDAAQLEATVREFNAAIRDDVPFDAAVKDGRAAEGIEPPKSHWAQALDTPPYYGFAVTCGVTFTFGGVHIDEHARVLDAGGAPIPGLYAAGELVGGLFHANYPGGTGLTAGAVFGRRAGAHAAS